MGFFLFPIPAILTVQYEVGQWVVEIVSRVVLLLVKY